jgi:hypothetical protein
MKNNLSFESSRPTSFKKAMLDLQLNHTKETSMKCFLLHEAGVFTVQ